MLGKRVPVLLRLGGDWPGYVNLVATRSDAAFRAARWKRSRPEVLAALAAKPARFTKAIAAAMGLDLRGAKHYGWPQDRPMTCHRELAACQHELPSSLIVLR